MSSQFVTKTRSILSAEGVSKNNIYYDVAETRVQNVECQYDVGKWSVSLNSLSFGSTSQILIPNQNIVSQTFITFELPPVPADVTLCEGWAISLIRDFEYTWSQANVSQLRIDSKSIYHILMAEADTQQKRKQIMRFAGEAVNQPTTKPIYGTVCLPLPWSALYDKQKGFDTKITRNPIAITLTLASVDQIYGGTGVKPTGLVKATVFTREGVLTDRSMSISSSLMNDSSLLYQHPFVHKQSNQYVINSPLEELKQVELQQILDSDLLGISFSVHYVKDQRSTGGAINPLSCCELLDIGIDYAGQSIVNLPGNSQHLIAMIFDESVGYDGAYLNTIAPYSASPVVNYPVYIPMGAMKNVIFTGNYDNTQRFSSQNLLFKFNPQRILPSDSLNEAIVLHVTYYYSALATFNSGVCNITFS